MSGEHNIELVREALQVHVNEAGEWANNGGWLVAHFVAAIGLYRANEDGSVQTFQIVASPLGQADYITDGLLLKAPDVLADLRAADDDCESESESD